MRSFKYLMVQDKPTGRILYKGLCHNGLYPIISSRSHSVINKGTIAAFLGKQVAVSIWHKRLGHPSNTIVSQILNSSQVSCVADQDPSVCQPCLEGKFSKLPFSSSRDKSVHPFDIVHSDVWGPAPCVSLEGFKYYVTFINHCTKFCWIFPICNKSDVSSTFVSFYNFIFNQFQTSIKILHSDGGGEYIGKAFQLFLSDKGIKHQLSCLHTPEQNGIAERKHRHIIETSITLLQSASLPSLFWSFACQTSVYLINRMPSPALGNKSPFQLVYNFIPTIQHLKVFGCSCYPWLRPYTSTKLDPRTTKCVFLGYASKYKGFLCYDASKNKMYVSRHVLFDETEFPYHSLVSTSHPSSFSPLPSHISIPHPVPDQNNVLVVPQSSSPSTSSSSSGSIPLDSVPISSVMPNTGLHHSSTDSSTVPSTVSSSSPDGSLDGQFIVSSTTQPLSSTLPVVPEFQPDQLQVVFSIPPVNLHPMQTWSKSGIVKKIALLAAVHENDGVDLTQVEPATYKYALKSPVWYDAMKDEIAALHNQGTWSLVPLPQHKNLVECKWVYKIKKNADGSIGRYKARLVEKGFSQEEGIDYGETFRLVEKGFSQLGDIRHGWWKNIYNIRFGLGFPKAFKAVAESQTETFGLESVSGNSVREFFGLISGWDWDFREKIPPLARGGTKIISVISVPPLAMKLKKMASKLQKSLENSRPSPKFEYLKGEKPTFWILNWKISRTNLRFECSLSLFRSTRQHKHNRYIFSLRSEPLLSHNGGYRHDSPRSLLFVLLQVQTLEVRRILELQG
ncbi:hypothetical protein C1H46_018590 [Malus baccata]|uniref:Integrase catalytic domain-containing protein n=1 Tax=Malus baccata TaxID=106549 RepID=A0A540MAZ4_MALBA|nr:hypothetical protein C1H46_018590 [Malus baccata]